MATTAHKSKHHDPFLDPDSTLVWSADQICQILSCGISTLDSMIASGEFPEPFRVGKKLRRWSRDTVIDWIRAQDTAAPGPGRPRNDQ